MTSNFRILVEFKTGKHHDEIHGKVERIETMINNHDYEYIYIDARKILELLFSSYSQDYDSSASLNEIIAHYVKVNIVPTKVKNALFFVKEKGNEDAHVVKMLDAPFSMKKDIFASIELLKMVFICIKWFSIENNKNSANKIEENYKFDSHIYAKSQIEREIVDNSISAETDSLVSTTKGIFELINSDFSFLIPTYQRAYSWSIEQVDVFLQDIKDRTEDKEVHYMGVLAIAVDDNSKVLRLIDGQQRITTSLLLLKVIIEYFLENKSALKMPKELESLKLNISKKYRSLSGPDRELNHVKMIIEGAYDLPNKVLENSNAFKNYLRIKEYINFMSPEGVDEFYTTFVHYFVIVELKFRKDLGSEIQIFENLNSKGLELSQWDLIKNYIYKHVHIDLLLESESDVEQLLNQLFVIPANIAFQENKYKQLSEFFIYYSRIKYRILNNSSLDDKGRIHKVFASVWPSGRKVFNTIAELRSSLLEISKFFSVYIGLTTESYNNPNSALFELRLPISNSSIKTAHLPLMMNLIVQNGDWSDTLLKKLNNKDQIVKLYNDVEKYLTRLIVVSNVGQSLPSFFDRMISDNPVTSHGFFKDEITTLGRQTTLPLYKDFIRELKGKNDWQKEYAISILRRLEEFQNIQESAWRKILFKPTLEHIFPQKPDDDSEWVINEKLSSEKFKTQQALHLNMLGNYLILSGSINSKAGNKNFANKKLLYKNDADLKILNGKFHTGNLMNLLLKDSFTFEDIIQRTNQLTELIAPLYKLSFEK